MLTIDKISDTAIRLDDGVNPADTHAVYRARIEKDILILSPLSGPGRTFAAPFRTVQVNGQTFDTPENLLDALAFIGNFNAGGGTSQTTLPPFEAGKFYAENRAIVEDGVLYTAKTDFTAGAAFDPSDWLKTGNGNYSPDEVRTAEKWIDGKPIYRRVYTFQATTVDTAGFAYNRTRYATLPDGVINIEGTFIDPAEGMRLPLPHSTAISASRDIRYNAVATPGNKRIDFVYCLSNPATDGGKTLQVRIRLSYTKTTD